MLRAWYHDVQAPKEHYCKARREHMQTLRLLYDHPIKKRRSRKFERYQTLVEHLVSEKQIFVQMTSVCFIRDTVPVLLLSTLGFGKASELLASIVES